jgi:hypothetical protein
MPGAAPYFNLRLDECNAALRFETGEQRFSGSCERRFRLVGGSEHLRREIDIRGGRIIAETRAHPRSINCFLNGLLLKFAQASLIFEPSL